VLRVGDGNTPNAVGSYIWVPVTDVNGGVLPTALTITDPNGVVSVDARNTVNLPVFKGTDYQRPEDLQIQTVKGRDYLYVTTTATNVTQPAGPEQPSDLGVRGPESIDLSTGVAVGAALGNVDNLAIDQDGNIYIIEDSDGGAVNDIWFAQDLNGDGDLTDQAEGLGRWATNGTPGSELTGLYFDLTNNRRAWVNIQHPDSGNDRTIEITIW
jgi:secreted PhoX family phosphatase